MIKITRSKLYRICVEFYSDGILYVYCMRSLSSWKRSDVTISDDTFKEWSLYRIDCRTIEARIRRESLIHGEELLVSTCSTPRREHLWCYSILNPSQHGWLVMCLILTFCLCLLSITVSLFCFQRPHRGSHGDINRQCYRLLPIFKWRFGRWIKYICISFPLC